MGRKILFITTDQQRHDALGCNGGKVARTPVVDGLAVAGINYKRAHNQNVVCMPARSTMLTGQHVRSHGVISNGIPLPEDAPDVVRLLKEQGGYRTALIGKAHFEPSSAPGGPYFENYAASRGCMAHIAVSSIWSFAPIPAAPGAAFTIIRNGCRKITRTRWISSRNM